MSDQTAPDSPPRDDERTDIEQAVAARSDAVENQPADEGPDPGNGSVGGTDGVVRNQDDDAQ